MCSSLISGLVNETKCTLQKFTGVTELRGVMDAPVGCGAIQKNLIRLEKWDNMDLMKTPKANTEPPTQGGTIPHINTCWGPNSWKAAWKRGTCGSVGPPS